MDDSELHLLLNQDESPTGLGGPGGPARGRRYSCRNGGQGIDRLRRRQRWGGRLGGGDCGDDAGTDDGVFEQQEL